MSTDDHLCQAIDKLNAFSSCDNQPLRTFSARSVRRFKDPYEALERILNKTTLTTQKVTHGNIVELGGNILSKSADDNIEGFEKSIQEAVDASEVRSTRELKAALKRLGKQKDEERQRALNKQQEYADRNTQRISDQRDRAEAERMKDLIIKLNLEKEAALQWQRDEDELLKKLAVADACAALQKKLQQEAAADRENAIAEALKQAEIRFREREEQTILATRKACDVEAQERAEKQAWKHQQHVERLNKKYEILQEKLERELALKAKLDRDFQELQNDYKRFLDYTDGYFHSDYLMRLRHIGIQKVMPVAYEDVTDLEL